MLKLTAEKIGVLIGKSPSYVYQLLRRKKLKLKEEDLEKIIDLILAYRVCRGR